MFYTVASSLAVLKIAQSKQTALVCVFLHVAYFIYVAYFTSVWQSQVRGPTDRLTAGSGGKIAHTAHASPVQKGYLTHTASACHGLVAGNACMPVPKGTQVLPSQGIKGKKISSVKLK